MSITEFSNEFDILYDSIASKGAPGIDLYEKSVYLTKAQLELIKEYYNPNYNKVRKGFENSETHREYLKELIRDIKTSIKITSEEGINENSQFFKLPSDVLFIINEQATIALTCNNTKGTSNTMVIPKTHDEYNIQINNPFKKPNNNITWRMDYYSHKGGNKNVELISPHIITKYHVRYIKYPRPIILTNLKDGEFSGMNLTIDGLYNTFTSELHKGLHSKILDRAVELAHRDYLENNLQNKIQTNLRNE